jgi:translation elongation factor EF-4
MLLVANFYLAFAQGLHLLPVVNKVDLPSADPERALEQMKTNFELDPQKAVLVSAKTGLNVESILPAVIEQTPPYGNHLSPTCYEVLIAISRPAGSLENPLKMLLIDSWYDNYKGVILLVRIFDGALKPGDLIVNFATKKKYTVGEVGIMYPLETATSSLRAGQVGYCYFNPGMKQTSEAKIGSTFCHVGFEHSVVPCEGFEEPQPMVGADFSIY